MTVTLPSIQKPSGKGSPNSCASPGTQGKTTDLNVLEDILNKCKNSDGYPAKKLKYDHATGFDSRTPDSPVVHGDDGMHLPQLIDESRHGNKKSSAFHGILRQCSLRELIFGNDHHVQLLSAGAFDELPAGTSTSAFLPSISGKHEEVPAPVEGSKDKKAAVLPGGVHLWRCGVLLAYFIVQNPHYLRGQNALELGAGTGLVGLVASRLCEKITITDCNRKLVQLINHNIVLNSMETTASGACLDWTSRSDTKSVLEDNPDGFDLVLAADALYEDSALEPFWQTARQMLAGHGAKLIVAHEHRSSRLDGKLYVYAAEAGFSVETIPMESFMPYQIKGLWGNLNLKRSDWAKFTVLVCTLLGPLDM